MVCNAHGKNTSRNVLLTLHTCMGVNPKVPHCTQTGRCVSVSLLSTLQNLFYFFEVLCIQYFAVLHKASYILWYCIILHRGVCHSLAWLPHYLRVCVVFNYCIVCKCYTIVVRSGVYIYIYVYNYVLYDVCNVICTPGIKPCRVTRFYVLVIL